METRDGRLQLNVVLSIGQNEVDTTSERIKFVNEASIRQGKLIFGDVNMGYGYKSGIIDGMKKIAENLRNSSAEMTPTRQLKQLRNPQIHLTPVFLSSRSTTSPLRTALCATKTNHRALMSHSLTYR